MSKLRQRSMSVFVPKDDNRFSKRFEGVASDNDAHSDSEIDEDDDDLHRSIDTKSHGGLERVDWTKGDYDMLVEKLRAALPKKDTKKFNRTLQTINWEEIEVGNHSSEDVKNVAESLIAKIRRFRTLGEMLNDIPELVNKLLSAEKPKAPPNAYALFVKENLLRYKSASIDMKNVFKVAAKEFHKLSDKKKKKFEDNAARLKQEYSNKMAKYYEDHPDMTPQKRTKRKEPNKTPFNLFYRARRETSSNISMLQLRKEWEELPIKKKLKYIRESFASESAGKHLNKKEQEILDRDHGKPEFIGRNVFELYARKQRTQSEMLALSGKEREQQIRKDYKALTNQERLDLKAEYAEAREKYITQYRAYIEKLPVERREAEIEHIRGLTESKKRDKKLTNSADNASDLYSGSGNEDPPIAESTTIKKVKSKKQPSLPESSAVEVKRESSCEPSASPSKRSKPAAELTMKAPVLVPPLIISKKKTKTDSSSDEASKQRNKKDNFTLEIKRDQPNKSTKSGTELEKLPKEESCVDMPSTSISKKSKKKSKIASSSDEAPEPLVSASPTKNGSVMKESKKRSSMENVQSQVEQKKSKTSTKKGNQDVPKPAQEPLKEPERPPGEKNLTLPGRSKHSKRHTRANTTRQ
ncbi:nucleolar transcription factor 1-like isoform X2 [Topomyia yanbarensis]|uniref:nucleolar transcription factor 1-like isoform X2 n=1 Tax=Topomyia yanbarensis TaxID=2498891 RepID=UPI00273B5101|nr:nucleolar transcription factor 1-like isoform X2 [Topomyia yanbarensis]XP_058827276.1 nucleolar transcription factor 1-like isoform X2 [Topomyia yanbarensis]